MYYHDVQIPYKKFWSPTVRVLSNNGYETKITIIAVADKSRLHRLRFLRIYHKNLQSRSFSTASGILPLDVEQHLRLKGPG